VVFCEAIDDHLLCCLSLLFVAIATLGFGLEGEEAPNVKVEKFGFLLHSLIALFKTFQKNLTVFAIIYITGLVKFYVYSSIAGTKMIPFPPYKAPQTQPRLPSHTKK